MIYRDNSITESSRTNVFKRLLKAIFLCIILCMICIFAISVMVTYTEFSEEIITPSVNILRLFALILCAIIFTYGQKTAGWIKGMISGCGFSLCIYLIGLIFVENFLTESSPVRLLAEGIFMGMTGGIIGINLKSKKHK